MTEYKKQSADEIYSLYGGLTSTEVEELMKGCSPSLALQLRQVAQRLNWELMVSGKSVPWTERYEAFINMKIYKDGSCGYYDKYGKAWTKYDEMIQPERNLIDALNDLSDILDLKEQERERSKANGSKGGRKSGQLVTSEEIAKYLKRRNYVESSNKKDLVIDAMTALDVKKTKVTDAIREHGLSRPRSAAHR